MNKQLPKHWQTALFDKFSKIYRQKFSDQFANDEERNETMLEWGEALEDLTGTQIKLAIEVCRNKKDWPPSIAEFREMAINKKTTHHGAAYKAFKSLPKPDTNPEVKSAAIKELRGLLGRKTPKTEPRKRFLNIPTQKDCEIKPETTGIKKPADRANEELVTSIDNIGANQ